jgi:NADPH-dependent curcumin reductase CurA
MRAAQLKHYNTPFELDGPITNAVLAKVLKSDSPDYKPGDLIIAYIPIAEYGVIEDLSLVRSKIEDPNGVKNAAWYLGPLGMPGLTAYSSLYEIGKPKKGETIYINSAAGAVGQIVGQIAKREGLRVIGSVGSDEKLDFIINELGFDGGFNYKKERPSDAFERLVPDGFDILYENVGGEQMEAALEVMKHNGRVIICGMVSESTALYLCETFPQLTHCRFRSTIRSPRSATALRIFARSSTCG